MGKTFWSMHHFCWALIHQQRANLAGTSAQERAYRHRKACDDIYFVINYAKERGEGNFVMMPELYYRCGDAYAQIDDYAAAIGEFDKALRVKQDYWPPYDGKAQILDKLGKRKEAREVLEQGLRAIPGEPNLTASLIKIGGKPPPVAAKPAANAAEATAAMPASTSQ
jgi:tetratricopeptide (TPR) repeat protein